MRKRSVAYYNQVNPRTFISTHPTLGRGFERELFEFDLGIIWHKCAVGHCEIYCKCFLPAVNPGSRGSWGPCHLLGPRISSENTHTQMHEMFRYIPHLHAFFFPPKTQGSRRRHGPQDPRDPGFPAGKKHSQKNRNIPQYTCAK